MDERKSGIEKRSLSFHGRKTSISLEDAFWEALREIAAEREMRVGRLVEKLSEGQDDINWSSAIRVYVLEHFMRLLQVKGE